MAEAAVLALDVGTSSCRASLYGRDGQRLRGRNARVSYAPEVTADGGAELDPARLLEQVGRTIDRVLHGKPPRIVAVATSTFWHSLLGLDARGRPLTPLLLWLDARSRGDAAELRRRLDERAVHARVGTVLHWSYWPAKLSWLRRTQPDTFARVRRWVSFGEYAFEQITGEQALSVSMASGTGLMDAHTCGWDAELLECLGVDAGRLGTPRPLASTAMASNESLVRWPALRGVPWLAAVGDGACSNLGAGCTTPDRFALMIGTSGAERAVWRPQGAFEIPWGTWCYRVDEERIVLGGALNDGGSLLDWLRHALRLPAIERVDAEVAALEPDAHGLTVLPFWGGERSPGWADDARGAIVGLRLHTRPVEIVRAGLEAVALRFGELDRMLLQAMPAGRHEVIATGGALLHSAAWLQIVSDVLGRPVLASAEPEASSRGVSLLALETLGALDLDGKRTLESQQLVTSSTYEPVAAHTDVYRSAAERQRHLYDQLVKHTEG